MKKLFALIISIGLGMVPLALYAADPGQQASPPPSVSQELVAEGDFAFQLAPALKLGTPDTEAQAEEILASVGIAPKNGWIADYPMTPIVVGEVQNALIAAAAANKLPMGKDEALNAFQRLASQFNLAIAPATGQYAETQPPTTSQYIEPPALEDYYAEEGPPVVTYYPPPWDYSYLYAWVPYPFWCSGFFFPGFFVLNDFDVVFVGDHGHHHGHDFDHHGHDFDHHGHDFDHRITNHFSDPKTHQFMRVDPTTRTRGFNSSATHTAAFNSPGARRGAASIMNRSVETARGGRPLGATNRSFRGGSAPPAVTGPRGNPGNAGSFRSFRGSSADRARTFGTAPRFFSRPSQGSVKSFSPPARSFNSPPMTRNFSGGFRGFQGGSSVASHSGGFSGGFHGGGFSRGGGGRR